MAWLLEWLSRPYRARRYMNRVQDWVDDAIERLTEVKQQLKEQSADMTSIRAVKMDGMPRGSGYSESSALELAVMKKIELEESLPAFEAKVLECMQRRHEARMNFYQTSFEVERFIAALDDPRLRLFLSWRFIDGMSWADMAKELSKPVQWDDNHDFIFSDMSQAWIERQKRRYEEWKNDRGDPRYEEDTIKKVVYHFIKDWEAQHTYGKLVTHMEPKSCDDGTEGICPVV